MRIERITDIQEVLKCLPFEREIRKKGRSSWRERDILLFVESQLENSLFGFWMAYDEKNDVIGYVAAMLNPLRGFERLYLFRIYAKAKELMNEFETILKQWAKPYGIKIAQMTVTKAKDIKAFQKKYGYFPVSVNMERRY